MASTVYYKGQTLTTVNNQTRTLLTEGKYMEDDVTIIDVTTGGGCVDIVQDANGFLVLDPDCSPNGTLTQDQDGFLVFSTYDICGQRLEYEEGTWTPTEDIARPTISFANIHTARPFSIIFADINNTPLEGYNHAWIFSSFIDSVGAGIKGNVSGNTHYYARVTGWYLSTGSTSASVANYNITNTTDSSGTTGMGYWATTAGFIPGSGSTSRYWKSGRTYKWIAVWKPTV